MTTYCSEKCRMRDKRFHVLDCQPNDVIKQMRSGSACEVTFVSDDSSEESDLELISGRALSTSAPTTSIIIEKSRLDRSVLELLFPEKYKTSTSAQKSIKDKREEKSLRKSQNQ